MAFSILSVDDELSVRKSLYYIFKDKYPFFEAETGAQALDILKTNSIDLVFLDLNFPEEDGYEILKQIKSQYPEVEVIMLTATGDIQKAIQCIKEGAEDFLIKPLEVEQIRKRVKNLEQGKDLTLQNMYLQSQLEEKKPTLLIGQSKGIQEVKQNVKKVASTDSTVLITGESGTGKELVARMIHEESSRIHKNFVAINCAAIPRELMESEFFGHEMGAFTSATQKKVGKLELADGGTVFLDEIGSMPLELQGKLLRVLQEKSIERVGGTQTLKIDFRLVAATNDNLNEMVKDGTFREDLYYRLNVIPIKIPSLRERKEDIGLLLQHFLERFNKAINKGKPKKFHRETLELLTQYGWPGNVRELQNLVERLVILSPDQKIYPEDLSVEYRVPSFIKVENSFKGLKENLAQFEKQLIIDALKQFNGNQTKTAEALGIHRNTLINKMDELMISKVVYVD